MTIKVTATTDSWILTYTETVKIYMSYYERNEYNIDNAT